MYVRRSGIRHKEVFPCPLCGGTARMHEAFGQPSWAPPRKYAITCDNKDCSMGHVLEFGYYWTEEEAIRVWEERCKEVGNEGTASE